MEGGKVFNARGGEKRFQGLRMNTTEKRRLPKGQYNRIYLRRDRGGATGRGL